jgi:hypothetical protein
MLAGSYLLSTGYSNSELMEKVGLTAFQEMNRMEDEYLDTILISKTIARRISP